MLTCSTISFPLFQYANRTCVSKRLKQSTTRTIKLLGTKFNISSFFQDFRSYTNLIHRVNTSIKDDPMRICCLHELDACLPTLNNVMRHSPYYKVFSFITDMRLESEMVSYFSSRESFWIWDKANSRQLKQQVAVGRFSPVDKQVILSSWKHLCEECDIKDEREFLTYISSNTFKEGRSESFLKNILVGCYLKKDLDKVRLCMDVMQKTKFWLCNNGSFTPSEDRIIVNYVRKCGGPKYTNWLELAKVLGRDYHNIITTLIRRYDSLQSQSVSLNGRVLKHTNFKAIRRRPYTLYEDKLIMNWILERHGPMKLQKQTFQLTLSQYRDIGKLIDRVPASVCRRWNLVIKPVVKKYHYNNHLQSIPAFSNSKEHDVSVLDQDKDHNAVISGDEHTPAIDTQNNQSHLIYKDIRLALVDHLIEQGYKYRTEVDWITVAEHHLFIGETPSSLSKLVIDIANCVLKRSEKKLPDILTLDELRNMIVERPELIPRRNLQNDIELMEYYHNILQNYKKNKKEKMEQSSIIIH